jgi:hypothetical protein
MEPSSTRRFLSASSNFTVIMLVAADLAGVLLIFNFNHWMITGVFASDLLLTWKLVLVAGFVFLYNYLMDLYTFDSALSQLGMLERSLIAMMLAGITIAIAVYLIGPAFIGGFVGRGVLASSLIMAWLWALGARYLMNTWITGQRQQIQWLVMSDDDLADFIKDFRSLYGVEQLLVLRKPEADNPEFDDPGISSVGTWNDLKITLVNNKVNGVIVASPDKLPEALIDKLMDIRIGGVRIYTMSDFYEKYLARLPVFQLNQQWIAMTHGFELIHNPIGLRFKRYIDIAIAIAGGLLLLPVIAGLAISIAFTSGLPVLYRQVRTGENDKEFTLYKFRTMVKDAEADGAQFAQEEDPRITPLRSSHRKRIRESRRSAG